MIVAIVVIIFLSNQPKKESTELGKLKMKRPPKIRIVYSKKLKPNERPKISSSNDVIDLLRELWSSQVEVREEFLLLLLDRSNRVLGYELLSKGGISGTVADLRLIFSIALTSLASAIIIAHNHPSGNIQPSHADINLTQKIKEAGVRLEIPLLDHVILTKESHYSFADEGRL
jgi:DNA repair protein RadC